LSAADQTQNLPISQAAGFQPDDDVYRDREQGFDIRDIRGKMCF
jgi:hypothetical protein